MQKKTLKEFYETPLATVFEIRQEGVICQSGGTEQYTPGGSYGDGLFD
jgi:hypothetical protein